MSQVISRSNSEFLYQQVIQLVRDLCLQGSLLPGEKLPSLRKMADKLNISIPTVKQAYQLPRYLFSFYQLNLIRYLNDQDQIPHYVSLTFYLQ